MDKITELDRAISAHQEALKDESLTDYGRGIINGKLATVALEQNELLKQKISKIN